MLLIFYKNCKNIFFEQNISMELQKNAEKSNKKFVYSLLTGSLAGFFNGMFGGGGGMIVVPMLIYLLKCPPQKAHATAIFIILPLSIVSGLFYLSFGTLMPSIAFSTTIGVVVGGTVGAFLLSKLSNEWLVVIFSVIMAIAGFKFLFF